MGAPKGGMREDVRTGGADVSKPPSGYDLAVQGMAGPSNQYGGAGIYTTKPPAPEASALPPAITDTQISDAAGAAGAEEMKKARGRAATIFGGMKGGSGSVAKRTLLSI